MPRNFAVPNFRRTVEPSRLSEALLSEMRLILAELVLSETCRKISMTLSSATLVRARVSLYVISLGRRSTSRSVYCSSWR